MQMRLVKPSGDAERATQTTLDTIEISKKLAAAWKKPPFQREVRITTKVLGLAEDIKKNGGVIPGILTLGVLDGDVYIVDGQHRLQCFQMSEVELAYADVRTHYFKTMGEMADEYVRLNSSLVRLRPDDIMKGLEQSNAHLKLIRRRCPYVGYDRIRNGANAPVLSMATVIRVWCGSRNDVPALHGGAQTLIEEMDNIETGALCDFLDLCFAAWKRDSEYFTLWGSLNLILCAWLYRRVVIGDAGKGLSRATKLDAEQFRRCLLSLSASPDYMDYQVSRRITDRDRAPAYNRLKVIFAKRYWDEHKKKLLMPSPAWAHTSASDSRRGKLF